MTTIARVETRTATVRLHTPFVTALRRTETTDTVVVTITDSDGRVGWGEAPQVWQVTGESLASATACIESMLAPVLLGHALVDRDDLATVAAAAQHAVARNFGAKAAVDAALHDLVARAEGTSVAALLSGRPDGIPARLTTDVTLSAGAAAALADTARERVGAGFTTLKMKVGTDASTDVQRVASVRDAVGPRHRDPPRRQPGVEPRGGRVGHPRAGGRRPRGGVRRAAGRRRRRRGPRVGALPGGPAGHGRRVVLRRARPRAHHPARGGRPRQRQARQVRVADRGPSAPAPGRGGRARHDRRLHDGDPHRRRGRRRPRRGAPDDGDPRSRRCLVVARLACRRVGSLTRATRSVCRPSPARASPAGRPARRTRSGQRGLSCRRRAARRRPRRHR